MLGNSLGGKWSPQEHSLNILLAKLLEYSNDPLVEMYAYKDAKQPNRSIIYVSLKEMN